MIYLGVQASLFRVGNIGDVESDCTHLESPGAEYVPAYSPADWPQLMTMLASKCTVGQEIYKRNPIFLGLSFSFLFLGG
jgi:hypothetical protein